MIGIVLAAAAAGPFLGQDVTEMKAVRFHEYGGREVLVVEQVAVPSPGAGELLVRVKAAGVNPVDWKLRAGGGKRLGLVLPFVPGFDVAGTVVAVGEGVTRFEPGDDVFAYLALSRGGGYAEYAIVREDEAAPKPATIDFARAAATPLAALTAWQALFDAAGLAEGQTVLIHGASGGVGTFAVQLAKARGAKVIGTASERNQAYLKDLGADVAIDYAARKFEEFVKDADVVLDTVGGETLARSFGAVKPEGFVVSIADDPDRYRAEGSKVRTASILVRPDGEQLAKIGAWIDEGTIEVVLSEILPLLAVQSAHEKIETGHTRGKIVLRVGGE
jgi:NADPH:quinone reductase-like Zn-dependent oxidoreductase